jgi:uncharacterized secreted protein with C-terminal beta-propeller domain
MQKMTTLFARLLLTGYLISLIPAAALAQSTGVFSDVTSDTQYSEAITYLKDHNIVQGYPDGTFAPTTNINRAEFTKILVGAVTDGTPTGSNCFPDVKDEWFAPFVCTAKKLSLVDGYPDGTFKPAEPINFAEAAKIIANAFKIPLGTDDPSVWFKKYITALQTEKAIPLSVEYFDEKITRDEMSEIIWRIKADKKDLTSRTYSELNGEGLVTVGSCTELEDRMKSVMQPQYPIMYDALPMDGAVQEAVPAAAPSTSETKSSSAYTGGGGSTDYSTTNVQEAGVDEADVIKNDGKYIYLIKGNTIRIVNAYPASEMKELISFQLGPQDEYFYPTDMYVNGDTLVAMGTASVSYPMPMVDSTSTNVSAKIMPPWYGGSKAKVYIVNIADRLKPKVVRTVDFDGSYNTSRRIGDTLYIVLNQYPYFPYWKVNEPITDFQEYLPKMTDSKDGKVVEAAGCSEIRLMPKPKSFNFMITAAIPLNDLTKEVSRSVIVGNSDNVYSSTSNLYVASTDWSGPYYYNRGQFTKLYRFALGLGKVEYKAEGLVPGTILNQFSMDEYRGNFRIATTQTEYLMNESKSTNNLFILDSGLKVLGKLMNVAPGEKIYSVRFMDDRAYMVTFKSVDPLFAMDLADPKNPKILGQLKIPGYSDYLHPYDANHIIGFGKDVDPAEAAKDQSFIYYTAVKGFKMGLFDVTDPTNPKEMFNEVIGDQGTYSELLYNHKALLFDKEKNLIAFPISVTQMPADQPQICGNYTYSTCPSSCLKVCEPKCTYENGITVCDQTCDGVNSCQESTYVYPQTVFVGAYVYGLDLQNGFKLKAKITHLSSAEITDLLKNGYLSDWEKTIQRILYIGDTLYTVSQAAVKANSLTNALQELNMIDLAGSIWNISYGVEPMVQ